MLCSFQSSSNLSPSYNISMSEAEMSLNYLRWLYSCMILIVFFSTPLRYPCLYSSESNSISALFCIASFFNQNLIAFFAIGYTDPTMTGDTRSVRELAQSYVRMIKHVQRHGPYFLGGQSFGGLVAYEMASILVEKEEEVSFVSMIDTFPWEMPNRSGAARLEILFGGKKLEHMMEELFQVSDFTLYDSFRLTAKGNPQV